MKKNSILTILFFVLSIAITVIVVLTLDTKDIVYNIRNDYGKVKSYRNIGHGEEKDGIIYSAALNK